MSEAPATDRRSPRPMAWRLPSEINVEWITAITDTAEQLPLDLSPLRSIRASLDTGDYSLLGMQHLVAIERKSAGDMLSCIGGERQRFECEIQRMLAFEMRVLVIEAGWGYFERGEWRHKVTPAQAIGALKSWAARGIQVEMLDTHQRAGKFVARMLFSFARHKWREIFPLLDFAVGEQMAAAQHGGKEVVLDAQARQRDFRAYLEYLDAEIDREEAEQTQEVQ